MTEGEQNTGLNRHQSNQGTGDRRGTQLGELRPNETREAKADTLQTGQEVSK